MADATRKCTTCGLGPPDVEFYEWPCAKCKTCWRARSAAYRAAHPEKVAATLHRWYQRNRDERIAYVRGRYWADPTKARAEKLAYREKNRAALSRASVAWKRANPERRAEYGRRRRAVTYLPVEPTELAQKVAYWGDRCWMCRGPWDQIDHVKPISKRGPHILANLRPICGPCNRRKSATWPLTNLLRRSA